MIRLFNELSTKSNSNFIPLPALDTIALDEHCTAPFDSLVEPLKLFVQRRKELQQQVGDSVEGIIEIEIWNLYATPEQRQEIRAWL